MLPQQFQWLIGDIVTKHITENTGWVVRTGVVAAMILAASVWFHNRLAAVELAQESQKTKIEMIYDIVKDVQQEVKRVK